MQVLLGADHAGFALKKELIERLHRAGYAVHDMGAHAFDPDDDYPYIAQTVAREVVRVRTARAVLICGSGVGMCIAANRVKGARAVVAHSAREIVLSRLHNGTNILCVSARLMSHKRVWRLVKMWLRAPISQETRHARRRLQIDEGLV